MASLVLDASAVVRIIEGSESSTPFQEAVLKADLVLAPELMLTDVANALWRLQRVGQLEADGLQRRLNRAAELMDVIEPDRNLQAEALALARREAAVLLTADQRLQQLAARVLP